MRRRRREDVVVEAHNGTSSGGDAEVEEEGRRPGWRTSWALDNWEKVMEICSTREGAAISYFGPFFIFECGKIVYHPQQQQQEQQMGPGSGVAGAWLYLMGTLDRGHNNNNNSVLHLTPQQLWRIINFSCPWWGEQEQKPSEPGPQLWGVKNWVSLSFKFRRSQE